MSDFKFSCPHCAQHIQVDSQWQGRELKCPACQETLTVPPTRPVSAGDPKPTASLSTEARPSRELPLWARVTWLVVLGALSPFIVSIAMLITAVLGPLAFLVGPVLGTFVSVGLTRHCREYAPPGRFWIYPVSVLSMYGLLVAQAFWPVGSKSAGHEPSLAGAEAAVAGGIAMFVILGSSLFWLLGAAIATLGSDREAPSFP